MGLHKNSKVSILPLQNLLLSLLFVCLFFQNGFAQKLTQLLFSVIDDL